jgi:transcriptional regulator with XRE-family HTH domain
MKKAKAKQDQAALLRRARTALGWTNERMAQELGKSVPTLNAWLAPKRAAKHRTMPASASILLARILAEHKSKSRA